MRLQTRRVIEDSDGGRRYPSAGPDVKILTPGEIEKNNTLFRGNDQSLFIFLRKYQLTIVSQYFTNPRAPLAMYAYTPDQ